MSTNRLDDVGGSARQAAAGPNGHIMEVAFLLPDWQVAALETAAHGDCLTCAQLVRRLIRDFLGQKIPSDQSCKSVLGKSAKALPSSAQLLSSP
jgi:hypothetical protein